MTFINQYSYKCLLGKQSKNAQEQDGIFSWQVGKKQHFAVDKVLTEADIPLLASLAPSNFHYLSETNLQFLKQRFKVDKSKNLSIIIDIQDLTFRGKSNASIRHCLNRCQDQFIIEPNFRDIKDVDKLIDEWSNNYTSKYFQDHSSKNLVFYTRGHHLQCTNAFIYRDTDLVAFGTLTPPDTNGTASYVIGKSLYQRHYGLSEFADVELYKLGQIAGIIHVNLGQASKGLLGYKSKFSHTQEVHFDGNISL